MRPWLARFYAHYVAQSAGLCAALQCCYSERVLGTTPPADFLLPRIFPAVVGPAVAPAAQNPRGAREPP